MERVFPFIVELKNEYFSIGTVIERNGKDAEVISILRVKPIGSKVIVHGNAKLIEKGVFERGDYKPTVM
ncbi:hypothetical protein [Bacillus albus]|uniref:hypothetical protein n=1 Tax=Bacillus albus TaxID=2026189 RepID=UPI0030145A3E